MSYYVIFGFFIQTPIMQGIPILVLTFIVLYLTRKLLSFVKALQAIQYVNNLMVRSSFYLVQYSDITPGDVFLYHR